MKRQLIYYLAVALAATILNVNAVTAADLYLNSPLTSDYSQSNDRIIAQSNCKVPTGNWAWFMAGVGITLQPGFRVESGAEFGAVIGDYRDMPQNLDYDNDGLLDRWELEHFGDISQGPDDDYDGDGFSNRIEYMIGTNPSDPGSKPRKGIYYEYDALGRIKEINRIPAQ